jgi:hypothetical protein
MSLIHTLLTPARKTAGKIMASGPKVALSVARQRVAICNNCPHLLKMTRNCKKCLCFVDEKALFQNEHCKIGKW